MHFFPAPAHGRRTPTAHNATVSAHTSAPDLLTLHALRLTGMCDADTIADRFALDRHEVEELLLDFAAYGWIYRAEFAGTGGWALTDAGRIQNERQLSRELARTGARAAVEAAHAAFLPLNARFLDACTRWQIRPLPRDPMAANDHTDFGWDDRVLDDLGTLGRRLAPLCARLTDQLARFDGYPRRYADALAKVDSGARRWVDGVGIDSCHRVWFELHEDLLATLGKSRGGEPAPDAAAGDL
jgi:hypothetical protein